MKKNKGIYIHIPFCDELCPYCAFSHVSSKVHKQEEYINRIIEDLKEVKGDISSIYLGGGTPSSLSFSLLEKLLKALEIFYHQDLSFTIEVNPTSLTKEKILLFKKYHINRISIGIQSFISSLQDMLNRHHDYEEIKKMINYIHEVGIHDINVDLMYGIPNETMDDLKKDLALFLSFNITHLSTYCLQIEEHTLFFNKHIKEMDEDLAYEQYSFICKTLKEHGFIHYEVSNFAKPSYESKHNLLYWRNEEYVGIGISSAGYENHIRYTNENSLTRYLKKESSREEEYITPKSEEEYFIILALRLNEGISLKKYEEIFHFDFLKKYQKILTPLFANQDLILENNRVYIPENKWFIMNQILIQFLDFNEDN